MTKPILIIGGRGKTGSRVADRLAARGLPLRLASRSTGFDWTDRSTWPAALQGAASAFNQNFDEGQFLEMVLGGEVALPVDTVREPFVDCDDIADVVTAALTDDRHIGQIYEVTGPRLLTFAEVVAEINRASGSSVAFRTMPAHEFLESLTASDVPDDIAGLLEELFSEVLDGRNESLADGVQRVLGRQPKDVADYAREAAAKGAWRQA